MPLILGPSPFKADFPIMLSVLEFLLVKLPSAVILSYGSFLPRPSFPPLALLVRRLVLILAIHFLTL